MSRNKPKLVGKIVHTLVFYDGPQLVLIETPQCFPVLGMAVEISGVKYPLFCVGVLPRFFELYLSGKVDLTFLIDTTPANRKYLTDLAVRDKDGNLSLYTAQNKDIEQIDLPEPGIFSTVHTHPLIERHYTEDDRQKFLIYGTWEAREFSQFNGRMSDAYSFYYIAKNIEAKSSEKDTGQVLHDFITDQRLQSGGAYLSLYGDFKGHATAKHPLRVAGIEYHSPGYIELAGNRQTLDGIIESINLAVKNHQTISSKYQNIRRVLVKEGTLSKDVSTLAGQEILNEYIIKQVTELAKLLGLPSPELILKACDNGSVFYAKLVLSFARRIRGLVVFYVQGRVKTEDRISPDDIEALARSFSGD